MRRGRPIPPVILSSEERETLERWRRRHSTSQALALRARIVLGSAEGATNTAIAKELRLTKQTVGKWRSRFLVRRPAFSCERSDESVAPFLVGNVANRITHDARDVASVDALRPALEDFRFFRGERDR